MVGGVIEVEATGVVGVCEGGFVCSVGTEVVVVEVVRKGSCCIVNLETKTEPLRIRNPGEAAVDESGRKKGVVIYFDILTGGFAPSPFEGGEVVIRPEGGVYFPCSENATEVLENDLLMTRGLDIGGAAVDDVEFERVEEGVSL